MPLYLPLWWYSCPWPTTTDAVGGFGCDNTTSYCPVLSRSKLLRGYISRCGIWENPHLVRCMGNATSAIKITLRKDFLEFQMDQACFPARNELSCRAKIKSYRPMAGREELCSVVGGCCSWHPYPQENTSWCFGPGCGSATGILATAGTLEQQGKQQQQQRQKEHLQGRQLH